MIHDQSRQRLARTGMAASVLAAFGASLCCIGPVAAALFGFTSLAAFAKYEPLRPIFSFITVSSLSTAFYMVYRKRGDDECAPGSLCSPGQTNRLHRMNRIILWTATLVALIVLTFPEWSKVLL